MPCLPPGYLPNPGIDAAAKSLQSCTTLCNSMHHSPPGSSVHGILQARILEWVAIFYSRGYSRLRDRLAGRFFTTSTTWEALLLLLLLSRFSRVQLFATPWTVAHKDSPSMGFSRQEYWSGLPLPSPLRTTRTLLLKRGLKMKIET